MTALFALYLVLLIIRPQEFVPGLMGASILQTVMIACLIACALKPDKRLSLPPYILAACLLIYAPLTIGLNGWWGGAMIAFTRFIPIIAIFLIASIAARSLRTLHLYMYVVLACACVLVDYAAIQLHTGVGPWAGIVPMQGRPYYTGIFGDPNDLGQLFVIGIGFAFCLLAADQSLPMILLLLGSVGWLCYGAILTNSRGALLATLTLFALEGSRRYGRIAVAIAAVLAVPALLAVTRLSQLSAGEESATGRLDAWYQGIQLLREHPLFGVGFGFFITFNDLTAHNSIVLPMAELGILGLTMWLGIIWYSARMLWWLSYGPHASRDRVRALREATNEADRATYREIIAARGLLTAFAGYGVGAFFLSQSYSAPLFLLCGLAVARFAAGSSVLPQPPTYRLLPDVMRLGGVSIAAIVGMYLTVKAAL
jgi:O-antigen ligase